MEIGEIGEILRNRRIFLKLKQEDLAEIAGIAIRSIHAIESGKSSPSFATLQKLAAVLGMELIIQVKDVEHG